MREEKTYPRLPISGLILPPRPVHPRALREASLSGTGERWPGKGATRTPNARRLKLHGPGATDGVTGLLGGSAVTPRQAARQCRGPKRWVETSATGGRAEESLKHRARDAGEKADLRHYQYRTAASAEIAVPPRCGDMPRPVGPSDPRRPARPRTLFPQAHRPNGSDAHASRERPHTSSPPCPGDVMQRNDE